MCGIHIDYKNIELERSYWTLSNFILICSNMLIMLFHYLFEKVRVFSLPLSDVNKQDLMNFGLKCSNTWTCYELEGYKGKLKWINCNNMLQLIQMWQWLPVSNLIFVYKMFGSDEICKTWKTSVWGCGCGNWCVWGWLNVFFLRF